MSSEKRDTQFAGFAKLLWEEVETAIQNTPPGFIPEGERLRRDFLPRMHDLLARRAYDLVSHTIQSLGLNVDLPFQDATIPEEVPDMTLWPEETK